MCGRKDLLAVGERGTAYSLVIIWALIGIASNQSGNQNIVNLLEASAIIVLLALAAVVLINKIKENKQPT